MAPTQTVFMPVDTVLGTEIAAIQNAGSAITDFTTGSGARTLCEAIAIVVSGGSAVADQLQLDSYLDTATGSALDALGANNWMVPRLPAVQAAGEITITRQNTSGALTLAAGWSQLATVPAYVGQLGVAVLTTEDADFADTVASVTVTAQAVLGGSAGNLGASTYLIPLAPVSTISSQNGFQVTTAFDGGVDVETDTAYRTRIPIAVQGRVLGRAVSFLAAALGVPGVLSAAVLSAGMERGNSTTVPVGSVEVYYQGSLGLLSAVTSAVSNAAALNQTPATFASVALTSPRGQERTVAALTVYCQPGVDTVALALAVTAALQAYVDGAGVGVNVTYGQAVQAVLAVPGVADLALPFTTFCLYGGSGAADISILSDSYANLAAADCTITVTVLP